MKEPITMVIHYKDGEEMGHHSVPTRNLENHIKFYEEYGYKCEPLSQEEYYKKFGEGGYELGKPK